MTIVAEMKIPGNTILVRNCTKWTASQAQEGSGESSAELQVTAEGTLENVLEKKMVVLGFPFQL